MVDVREEAPAAAPAVKRKPPMPGALQKTKLTVAQAAEQWEKAKRELERQEPLLEEAAAVLHAHFERTGRATYKDRIARQRTGGQLYLDQQALKQYLGAKFNEFQKRAKQGWTLKLLK